MKNETFENYNTVQHMPLRVYNRATMLANIQKDFGAEKAEKYASQFTKGEMKQMFIMLAYIGKFGREEAKKEVMKDFTPETSDEEVINA